MSQAADGMEPLRTPRLVCSAVSVAGGGGVSAWRGGRGHFRQWELSLSRWPAGRRKHTRLGQGSGSELGYAVGIASGFGLGDWCWLLGTVRMAHMVSGGIVGVVLVLVASARASTCLVSGVLLLCD